jgi:hypothetical protein|uniref:Uncharacterized protein n=1 Tax=viral metagenome TaxID=1070528 RepID=A0A6C0IZ62_9ZZZZ
MSAKIHLMICDPADDTIKLDEDITDGIIPLSGPITMSDDGSFNINLDIMTLSSSETGYLKITDSKLGFDSTISTSGGSTTLTNGTHRLLLESDGFLSHFSGSTLSAFSLHSDLHVYGVASPTLHLKTGSGFGGYISGDIAGGLEFGSVLSGGGTASALTINATGSITVEKPISFSDDVEFIKNRVSISNKTIPSDVTSGSLVIYDDRDASGKNALISTSTDTACLLPSSHIVLASEKTGTSEHYEWIMGLQSSGSGTPYDKRLAFVFRDTDEKYYFSSWLTNKANLLDLNFTGIHRNVLIDMNEMDIEQVKGTVVCCTGAIDSLTEEADEEISMGEALPVVTRCTHANCSKIFGVIGAFEKEALREYSFGVFRFSVPQDKCRAEIYACGEGAIRVRQIDGVPALRIGDLVRSFGDGMACLQTKKLPKYIIDQETGEIVANPDGGKTVRDMTIKSCTIAKINMNVAFTTSSSQGAGFRPRYECQYGPEGTWKWAIVACTYLL